MNGAEYVAAVPQVPQVAQVVLFLVVVVMPLALGAWRIWTSGGDR